MQPVKSTSSQVCRFEQTRHRGNVIDLVKPMLLYVEVGLYNPKKPTVHTCPRMLHAGIARPPTPSSNDTECRAGHIPSEGGRVDDHSEGCLARWRSAAVLQIMLDENDLALWGSVMSDWEPLPTDLRPIVASATRMPKARMSTET